MDDKFKTQLQELGQQAKKEAQAKADREAAANAIAQQQAAEAVDFIKEMGAVKTLKSSNRYQAPVDNSPIKPRQHDEQSLTESDYFYVGYGNADNVPATFSKNGQGHNDIRRLQSGHWPVVADVDLHGYNQEQAQQVLNEFIEFVAKRGVCGEIIHGSGLGSSGYKSVLKTTVRRWLMAHPEVLAYAEPHQGNDGAVRILIKRIRKNVDDQYE
ncbi:MAG: Smr/MutS family protein [Neisseria sp.]